jgi:hypothetical protein
MLNPKVCPNVRIKTEGAVKVFPEGPFEIEYEKIA